MKAIAKSLSDMGKHRDAIEVLKSALKQNPREVEIYCLLGSLYLTIKNLPQALATYMEGQKLTDKDARIPLGMGNV